MVQIFLTSYTSRARCLSHRPKSQAIPARVSQFKSGIKCLRTNLRTSPAVSSRCANAYQRAYGAKAPAEMLIGSERFLHALTSFDSDSQMRLGLSSTAEPPSSPHSWQCLSQYRRQLAPSKVRLARCHETQTSKTSHLAIRFPNPKVTGLWQGPTVAMSSLSRISLSP